MGCAGGLPVAELLVQPRPQVIGDGVFSHAEPRVREPNQGVELVRKLAGTLIQRSLQLRALCLADLTQPAVLQRAEDNHEQDQP